ncbi:hypothetical protein EYF80_033092 [Liparis tanakae]|uniref:Uncharacterized protein n=1 Tax=Liparis tanakae TaxID=230148 RepID=A0A4Z2GU50_9TELE|nr:hypothetical protein EYF80_033092 [Liparis tanakae]
MLRKGARGHGEERERPHTPLLSFYSPVFSGSSGAVPAMPLLSRPKAGSTFPVLRAASCTFFTGASAQYPPRAARAAADATLGSTTEARKATVLMTGFPDWLKGMGW